MKAITQSRAKRRAWRVQRNAICIVLKLFSFLPPSSSIVGNTLCKLQYVVAHPWQSCSLPFFKSNKQVWILSMAWKPAKVLIEGMKIYHILGFGKKFTLIWFYISTAALSIKRGQNLNYVSSFGSAPLSHLQPQPELMGFFCVSHLTGDVVVPAQNDTPLSYWLLTVALKVYKKQVSDWKAWSSAACESLKKNPVP